MFAPPSTTVAASSWNLCRLKATSAKLRAVTTMKKKKEHLKELVEIYVRLRELRELRDRLIAMDNAPLCRAQLSKARQRELSEYYEATTYGVFSRSLGVEWVSELEFVKRDFIMTHTNYLNDQNRGTARALSVEMAAHCHIVVVSVKSSFSFSLSIDFPNLLNFLNFLNFLSQFSGMISTSTYCRCHETDALPRDRCPATRARTPC